MKIYNIDGELILDVEVDDSSYRHRSIMGEHCLILKYALSEHVELPVGAYCLFQGEKYTLERPENIKMKHSRHFEYIVTMEAYEAKAKIWKFRNPVDGRLKFSLTAKPSEHLQMFVDNMNRRDSGWTAGECVEGVERLINYDHDYCWEAIRKQAKEFNTEFEISGKRVSLRKVEYNKGNPLPLSYGRGNGFKPGVGRGNSGGHPPTEILYVQGGSKNIDLSKYGSSVLTMPKGKEISYDGERFEGEEGYNESGARRYVSDEHGFSIRRADKELSSLVEDSFECSDIYPKREGFISGVKVVNPEKNLYDIIDNLIPAALDYEECLIAGETMTVIFQSGMLAGREFEVKYFHKAKTVNGVFKAARRFELVPQEIDGVTMPNTTFAPKAGDKYAVFNCMLPQAYICDNATKMGAEWDMMRAAVRRLFEDEDKKFSFTGELDGIWAKKNWRNIGGRIKLGGYILFSDQNFQKEGVPVRIISIKDYINNPHSPVIEISNMTAKGGFTSEIKKMQGGEVIAEERHKEALRYSKRRIRDAKETIAMLERSLLDNFSQSISPVAVRTMALLVGDESLQFRFVTGGDAPGPDPGFSVNYEKADKTLRITEGLLQHMTLGIKNIGVERKVSDYKFWDIPAYTSAVLDDGEKSYYIYAKCRKDAETGEFILSEHPVAMEAAAGVYHFLLGVLNRESGGDRSVAALYGFTEVLPGRITTDKIVSSDGSAYFDLINNIIGGRINFIDGIVSGLIGVGNEEGVNAGLNGEGTSPDDVRFWAGREAEDRAAAPFKVLHDGRLYAENAEINGKINSKSGNIGGFDITDTHLQSGKEGDSHIMKLSRYLLRYIGKDIGINGQSEVALGANVLPATAGGHTCGLMARLKDSDLYNIGRLNIGMYLDVSGDNKINYALFAKRGMFAGLRPAAKVISYSTVLGPMDHTVLVIEDCAVTLPDSPEDGQEYILMNTKNYTLRTGSGGRPVFRYYYGVTNPGGEFYIIDNAFVARAVYFSSLVVNGVTGVWFFIHNVQY